MFGLGMGEILILGAVGVLLFGAKRLPELGSAMGKAINNFKKGLTEPNSPKDEIEAKKDFQNVKE